MNLLLGMLVAAGSAAAYGPGDVMLLVTTVGVLVILFFLCLWHYHG